MSNVKRYDILYVKDKTHIMIGYKLWTATVLYLTDAMECLNVSVNLTEVRGLTECQAGSGCSSSNTYPLCSSWSVLRRLASIGWRKCLVSSLLPASTSHTYSLTLLQFVPWVELVRTHKLYTHTFVHAICTPPLFSSLCSTSLRTVLYCTHSTTVDLRETQITRFRCVLVLTLYTSLMLTV